MTITMTPTKARPHATALLWITDQYSDESEQQAYLLSREEVERLIAVATKALAQMVAATPPAGR